MGRSRRQGRLRRPGGPGLAGGYVGDTKLEEMGNRTMMLAAADAYLPGDANVGPRREWLNRWLLNTDGLPVADEANPTRIGGRPIAEWAQAQNVFDTFSSENHGSWNGMYQQSAGAYPGRNIVHYLIAGRPVPRSLVHLPSDAELFDVLHHLGTDAGVPVEHLIGDRQHLYGRSVVPLTCTGDDEGTLRLFDLSMPASRAWMALARTAPRVVRSPSNPTATATAASRCRRTAPPGDRLRAFHVAAAPTRSASRAMPSRSPTGRWADRPAWWCGPPRRVDRGDRLRGAGSAAVGWACAASYGVERDLPEPVQPRRDRCQRGVAGAAARP